MLNAGKRMAVTSLPSDLIGDMLPETVLPDAQLVRCGELLTRYFGFEFSPDRWPELERAFAAAAPELGCGDSRGCQEWLLSSSPEPAQLTILATHLTIGETYFFREPAAFSVLRNSILPSLIDQRRNSSRQLRLWSAGCSTGEEAYSIAIELARLLPDINEWDISLLASDINPYFLAKAQSGVYRNWSFREGKSGLVEGFFKRITGDEYAILPCLKELVSFADLNLIDDNYPSPITGTNAMDVIFCRNVLMYFRPDHAAAVIDKLSRCLVEGGWLVVSPVEVPLVLRPDLEAFRLPEVILHQKKTPSATPRLIPESEKPSSSISAAPPLPPIWPPDAEAMSDLARTAANQGRLEEALSWCCRALENDGLNPAWNYLHATILLERGEIAAAAAALRRTLYLDHHCVMAHYTMANLMARQGKPAAAGRHYRNAKELLAPMQPDHLLAESEGMTAGELDDMITLALAKAVPI
jgi:chemotaxis protein methyltransferase CheR